MPVKKIDKQEKKMDKPVWLKMSEKDLKEIIAKLAKEYDQPAKIGLILRDQYGVPSTKVYGKKLAEYLREFGLEANGIELKNAQKKMDTMKKHLEKNITDRRTKHKFQGAQSRVNVLSRYFKKKSK
jgi:small subunit ribosomal protein S15